MIVRILDVLGVLAIVSALCWLAIPSDYFVKPVSLQYDSETRQFVFFREVSPRLSVTEETANGPVSGHWGEWWSEVSLVGKGAKECPSGPGVKSFYQIRDSVSYELGDWATPCLDAGPPFFVTTRRQVLLFGWLPLRPSTNIDIIKG